MVFLSFAYCRIDTTCYIHFPHETNVNMPRMMMGIVLVNSSGEITKLISAAILQAVVKDLKHQEQTSRSLQVCVKHDPQHYMIV